jgi:hypothetical protein
LKLSNIYIVILALNLSCQDARCPQTPLSQEVFADLTAEFFFMEAHFQSVISDHLDSILVSNRNQIYEKFQTSDSTYQLTKKLLHSNLKCAYEMQKLVEEKIKSKKPVE